MRSARHSRSPAAYAAAVLLVALLSACQRDYQFKTTAIYVAPRGGYAIRIEGQGIVRAGHDVSQSASGRFTISPSRPPAPASLPPVTADVLRQDNELLLERNPIPGGLSSKTGIDVVSQLLSAGGYSVYLDEIEELVRAVEGVLSGPKGTLMSGQTKVLEVISTTFDH
jgi:hypothetical protein